MNTPTHSIRVDIGIDFTKVLSPENIPGLKIAYGISDESKLSEMLSHKIIEGIGQFLGNDFNGFDLELLNANLIPVSYGDDNMPSMEVGNKPTEWTPAPEDYPESESDSDELEETEELEEIEIDVDITGWKDILEDHLDDTEESENEIDDEDLPEISSDLIILMESIGNTVFKLESMASNDIHIYLNRHSEYGESVSNVVEVDVHNINRSKFKDIDDLEEIAYVVSYKDINKEDKTLKVEFEELNSIKEEK